MSVRLAVAEIQDLKSINVAQFCRDHGIKPWWFYDLRRRFKAGGLAAIEVQSRAPHRVANRTPLEVEDTIVELRKALIDQGLDAGPATIAGHLVDRGLVSPSESTIWRILKARGCVTPDPSKVPKRTLRRFAAARANECWQFDDTGWDLADGNEVKVLHVLDDCSRALIASTVLEQPNAANIFDAIAASTEEWGWPERVLCDNALAHHALHDTFAAFGVATRHGRPYHPQTTGKVERVHRTVKQYLAAHDAAATSDELQQQLDAFRDIYNHHRRHRAIGRQLPAAVWHATPKSGPADRPLIAATTTTEVHRVVVNQTGAASVTRQWRVSLGRQYAGRRATAIVTGAACTVVIDGHIVRTLTLDPTRRFQPRAT